MLNIFGTPRGQRLVASLTVPWSGIMAAFIYVVMLTAVILGGVSLAAWLVMAAYAVPLAAYAGLLVSRAVAALSAVVVDVAHTPEALLR